MAEPTDPLLGTVVGGRYRVVRRLGRGGMGAVYAAEQAPLAREVALKVLRPDLAGNEVAIERFKREAQLIGTLGHPHIVGIYDFGTADDGTLYIAMELLHGEDLAARLRRAGPLTWERALHVVEQIARGLAGAHAKGVIHRDLKPANVILMNVDGVDDFTKVVDFGIAKLITEGRASGGAPSLTGGGFIPGTAGYIAPENISGGAGDDPRSDLYSLGVTWFEMLTGRCPFVGDSAMAILLKQLNEDPPRPTQVAALELPPRVEELLMRLLDREPAARPSTANALLGEVSEVRRTAGLALAVETATATSMRAEVWPPPTRRSRTLLAAAVVAVVALAGGVGSALMRPRSTSAAPPAVASSDIYFPDAPRRIADDDAAVALPDAGAPELAHLAVRHPSTPTRAVVDAGPSTETPPDKPPVVPVVPISNADERWRDDAMASLSACDESCAKVIAGRLKDLDASTMTPRARAGVNECVAKCRRAH